MGFTRFALSASAGTDITHLIKLAESHELDAIEVGWRAVTRSAEAELLAARARGISVTTIDLGAVTTADDPRGELDRLVAFASAVSCRRVTLTAAADPNDTREQVRRWFDAMLRELAERCEEPGLSLVVRVGRPAEATSVIADTADLRDVLASVNRLNVSAEADLTAFAAAGEDSDRATASLVGRLGHVRLGDMAEEFPAAVVSGFLADLQSYGYADVVTLPADAALPQLLESLGGNVTHDSARVAQLQQTLAENNLDAAVLLSSENVLSISGYWPMNGTCVAVVPRTGDPHLLVPAGEEFWAARSGWHNLHMYQAGRITDPPFATTVDRLLRRLARGGSAAGRRVGVEGPFRAQVPPHMAHEVSGRHEIIRPVVASALDAEVVFFDQALCRSRAAKTPAELRALRRSAAIADVGLRTFRDRLTDGARDIDVATEVERAIETFGVGYQGASRVRGYAFVMSGPQTSQCHLDYEFSSTRRMRTGEHVLMELAVVADGYWQDLSRVFVIGEPTDQQRLLHQTAEAAFQAAARAAVPGATGAQVDAAAREVIDAAGLAEAYPHQTGHGVGIAFHEQFPLLKPGSDHVLEEGNVIAIEPGVYLPGVGGVRNEDNLVVSSSLGAASLQTIPHALNVER
ncbi:M24 family metallopeptidase [Nocardia sp. NBC_01009]|uniref:M24 family metallopeptidase n=1 Tax=Nocardia sp. NBC_01009 TaxID=2975996 RepID=UPI00386A7BA0|nr:M24 family metallopeptidase [Nocardia sp. NBC_01009]